MTVVPEPGAVAVLQVQLAAISAADGHPLSPLCGGEHGVDLPLQLALAGLYGRHQDRFQRLQAEAELPGPRPGRDRHQEAGQGTRILKGDRTVDGLAPGMEPIAAPSFYRIPCGGDLPTAPASGSRSGFCLLGCNAQDGL
jgi:hypothetical protein